MRDWWHKEWVFSHPCLGSIMLTPTDILGWTSWSFWFCRWAETVVFCWLRGGSGPTSWLGVWFAVGWWKYFWLVNVGNLGWMKVVEHVEPRNGFPHATPIFLVVWGVFGVRSLFGISFEYSFWNNKQWLSEEPIIQRKLPKNWTQVLENVELPYITNKHGLFVRVF